MHFGCVQHVVTVFSALQKLVLVAQVILWLQKDIMMVKNISLWHNRLADLATSILHFEESTHYQHLQHILKRNNVVPINDEACIEQKATGSQHK